MHSAARELAAKLPNATSQMLTGEGHDISPETTATVLAEFLSS
jgi:hypothetical protein